MRVPADRVVQVSLAARHRHGSGGGERVCLGKALAELKIRLLAVGELRQLTLVLEPDQDLSLQECPGGELQRLAPPGLHPLEQAHHRSSALQSLWLSSSAPIRL